MKGAFSNLAKVSAVDLSPQEPKNALMLCVISLAVQQGKSNKNQRGRGAQRKQDAFWLSGQDSRGGQDSSYVLRKSNPEEVESCTIPEICCLISSSSAVLLTFCSVLLHFGL